MPQYNALDMPSPTDIPMLLADRESMTQLFWTCNNIMWMLAKGLLAAIVIFFLIVWLNYLLKSAARQHAQRQAKAERTRPDGLPYPPSGHGLCDTCQHVFDKVYFVENTRYCQECYHKKFLPQTCLNEGGEV